MIREPSSWGYNLITLSLRDINREAGSSGLEAYVWLIASLSKINENQRTEIGWSILRQNKQVWKNLVRRTMALKGGSPEITTTTGYLNLGLVHPVEPVFNENHKSIAFVSNLSCLYCTQITLHVSAIRPSSSVLYIQKC
jgi:hypothetical protein